MRKAGVMVLRSCLARASSIRLSWVEIVFVTGEVLLLDTLELHVLEEMNLVLVFDVPAPKGAFGDVDLLRDFIKAPAIGAKGHELADFS